MQLKPWMKYTGAAIGGFIVGGVIVAAGAEETKTVTAAALGQDGDENEDGVARRRDVSAAAVAGVR
jgi:hypothetical protein